MAVNLGVRMTSGHREARMRIFGRDGASFFPCQSLDACWLEQTSQGFMILEGPPSASGTALDRSNTM